MLFNSYIFIFLFLPITLSGFYLSGRRGHHRIAISWLVAASLFFYGWWNPVYLGLILGSMFFNYAMGIALSNGFPGKRKGLLAVGVAINLGLIGYYKYKNFFVENINWALGSDFHLQNIILPLAISFFTFQQIAYLVDAYNGKTREYNFLHYCLFVTFFPQLIAGPIVHHKEMLPQFSKGIDYKLHHRNLAVGITIFTLGLFKKVLLADNIALYATPVFNAAEGGVMLTFFEAWGGALAYTFQLYFDFSGYSDMAIGLARMFGIRLPLNFNSPYKAVNIISFWRRWHITLARFLKDYLYIPLGGNRKGNVRRYVNLMITMLLGGLWHGAGWTFVLWGALHGFYLVLNHAWHTFRRALGHNLRRNTLMGRGAARVITFLVVVIAWVFFRAESFKGAANILVAMSGSNGISLPKYLLADSSGLYAWLTSHGFRFEGMFNNELVNWRNGTKLILFLFALSWYFPNVQQLMYRFRPVLSTYNRKLKELKLTAILWKPNLAWAVIIGLIFCLSALNLSRVEEFIYFQF